MASVSERVVGHVESMDPDEILSRSAQFEKIDTIARQTFGLNDASSGQECLSLNILTKSLSRTGEGDTSNCSVAYRIGPFHGRFLRSSEFC